VLGDSIIVAGDRPGADVDVLTDGRVYVGTTRWAGAVAFRPAFVNWRTTTADADLMLETVRDLGRRLL